MNKNLSVFALLASSVALADPHAPRDKHHDVRSPKDPRQATEDRRWRDCLKAFDELDPEVQGTRKSLESLAAEGADRMPDLNARNERLFVIAKAAVSGKALIPSKAVQGSPSVFDVFLVSIEAGLTEQKIEYSSMAMDCGVDGGPSKPCLGIQVLDQKARSLVQLITIEVDGDRGAKVVVRVGQRLGNRKSGGHLLGGRAVAVRELGISAPAKQPAPLAEVQYGITSFGVGSSDLQSFTDGRIQLASLEGGKKFASADVNRAAYDATYTVNKPHGCDSRDISRVLEGILGERVSSIGERRRKPSMAGQIATEEPKPSSASRRAAGEP